MLKINDNYRIAKKENDSNYVLERFVKGGKTHTTPKGKKGVSKDKWKSIGFYSSVAFALCQFLRMAKDDMVESEKIHDISEYINETRKVQLMVQDLYDIYRGD